jgi:hypothetical protein
MVKGINKQIIEIKCTNNEYFDKILLFVSADKGSPLSDETLLGREAQKICCQLTNEKKAVRSRAHILAFVLCGCAVLCGLMAVCYFI